MYTKEQLQQYPYFARDIEASGVDALLDPLTGVIARPYIIGFAQTLIAQGVPFTYGILDLDNFKFINDTYGHSIGDAVLAHMGEDLIRFLDGFAFVGRFGGDEFLIINLRDRAYDEKKRFLLDMYAQDSVVRKNIPLPGCSPFVTATLGCATFPDDADNYNDLFTLIDKALYRGKTKGRNCYIIYVEEKHKDIQLRQLARHGVYTALHSLIRQFEMVPGLKNKMRSVMPLLMEEMQISDLYYVGASRIMRAVRASDVAEDVRDIDLLMNDDLFSANNLDMVFRRCPVFFHVLQKREVETLLVVKIGMDVETDGYLICAEAHSRRIWQEDECAILYFLAKLLAARIRIDGEEIDAV